MTIRNIKSSPQGLKLIFRISLAFLVMVLAERAADLSHGEQGVSEDSDNGSAHSIPDYVGDQDQPNYTCPISEGNSAPTTQRLREGTILKDVIGRFKISGDRAIFTIKETGQTFGGLENLNLARVTSTIRDDPEADWSITGLITEHRGLNFLLVQKAIRKTNNKEASKSSDLSDPVSTQTEQQETGQSGEPTAF